MITPPPLPDDPVLAALGRLLDETHLAVPDDVPSIVDAAASLLGWRVVIYVADYDQRFLVPLDAIGPGHDREPLGIDTTLAGRAFRGTHPVRGLHETNQLWVPLIDSVERLGVLEVVGDAQVDFDAPHTLRAVRHFASLVGHLLAVKVPYGDGLDRARRSRSRTVASELIWRLLPPLTYACEGLVVSGYLEPCYEIAGDSFDYAVDAHAGRFAIFDPMGHDMQSGLMSAAALAAYRASRVELESLESTADVIDDTLREQFGTERFVTGILVELHRDTGRVHYVAAGHPEPVIVRDGKVVKQLGGGRRLPFGMPAPVRLGVDSLEPGDWLVLYTDGMVEARDAAGDFFGPERLFQILGISAGQQQTAPESLRRAMHAVIGHQEGVMQDDATIMLIEWRGGGEHELWPDTAGDRPRDLV
jgi:sigma-B regulation protein RsbU (phosphoserine phosphatase)